MPNKAIQPNGRATSMIAGRISRLTIASSSAAEMAIKAAGVSSAATNVIPGTSQAASSKESASTSHTITKRTNASIAVRIVLLI
jgi:hypothetical protein